MGPNDSIRLVAEGIAGRALLILAIVACFAMAGGFDYADQVASEAKDKQDRAARIAAYVDFHKDAIRLSHPCGATIRDGMTSVTMGPERCVRVKETKR
jgi:hypothetical protein